MSKIQSIFGAYATRLQVVIDTNLDRFAPTFYNRYFTWAPQQASLDFESVIGASRIEAAASIVNRDSSTPLRSRGDLAKMRGEIPAIKEMFKMKESDYRNFLSLQALNVDDATKRQQLLDFLFGDTLKVGNAAHKRLDIMALEGISTGKISLTVDNNPDGLVLTNAIDLLMPAGNQKQAATSWDNAATATPIDDMETVVKAGKDKGVSFAKILMSDFLFMKLKATKEIKDTLTAFFYGPKPQAGYNPVAVTTLDRINEFLTANRMPVIEIVDEVVGVEKDGVINTLRPFNENNVSFIPAGSLGTIKNALPIEQLRPVEHVSYATYNRALISKWSENEPFGEWTKVELNAFPAFDAIDSMFILEAIYA